MTDSDASNKLRVLVIDDNVDAAELLCSLLGLWGHDARMANDGRSGLTIADEFEPDVTILDIGLPEMDGHEVARRLRQLPSMKGKRIIAVSGYSSDADKEKSLASGFDRHLVKPVDFDDLREALVA